MIDRLSEIYYKSN